MDKISTPKLDTLKPVARPATAPLAPADLPAAIQAAPAKVADAAQVNVGKTGLDSAARTTGLLQGVPEVDFQGADPKAAAAKAATVGKAAAPEEESYYSKALNVFSNALSVTAKVALNPFNLAADESFLDKVKGLFSSEGKADLSELSKSGKLSAMDKNLTTLRSTLDKLLKGGADPATLEVLNQQALAPESIDQIEGKTTCPTSVFQKMLAEGNPGAYAKTAYDLFTTGKATLPDGTKLGLSEANLKWLKEQKLPQGELINAYVQVALTEAAVAPDVYDVATDAVGKEVGGVFGYFTTEVKERGGMDFGKVSEFYGRHEMPLFDPRPLASGTDGERALALKTALNGALASGRDGLSVPVHSVVGAQEKFHMVQVKGIDEAGNVKVFDPETGNDSTYTQAQFLTVVGWDITDADNVGGGRVKSGGSGSGTV